MLHHIFRSTVFSGAVFVSQAAFAEITAEQIWQNVEEQFKDAGYMVAATVHQTGDDVRVDHLQISQIAPDTDAQITFQIGTMTFDAQDDGRIAIGLPKTYPVLVRRDIGDDQDFDLSMTQYNENLNVHAAEIAGGIKYTYSADKVGIRLDSLRTPEFDPARDHATTDVSLHQISAQMTIIEGQDRVRETNATAGEIRFDLSARALGDDPFDVDLSATLGNMTYAEHVTLPRGVMISDTVAALRAGMAYNSVFGVETAHFDMSGAGNGDQFSMNATSGASDTTLSYSYDHLDIQGNSLNTVFNLSAPDVPIPIGGALEKASYHFQIPLSSQPQTQKFSVAMNMIGLGVSDAIWGLFDPKAHLSREPIGLSLKMFGTGRLGLDMLGIEELDRVPLYGKDGEIKSLTIENFSLNGLGGGVIAQGDFSFDPTALETYDGVPRPSGKGKIVLSGLNTVMTGLSHLGVIDDSQIFMVRMMLSGFSTPTGEDELTTKFEFTPDGKFYANGQRLK